MLGRVHYVELEPAPALRGRVKYWRLAGERASAEESQPVVPDGCVELIVHLGEPFAVERDGRRELQPRLVVAGPATAPVRLVPSGRFDVIGVRLEAGVADALIGASLGEIVDRIPAMEDVAPRFARDLGEELAEARGEAWVTVLERRLLRPLAEQAPTTARPIEHAVRRLRASGGRVAIGALAGELGLSSRQLERGFQRHVGLGPKTFARIVRFQRALALLGRSRASVAEIAARCGYFDQAHLVRDARQFAGKSPSALRAAEHELTERFADGAPGASHPSKPAALDALP
jgi:AraC-like DNA-binding protein